MRSAHFYYIFHSGFSIEVNTPNLDITRTQGKEGQYDTNCKKKCLLSF